MPHSWLCSVLGLLCNDPHGQTEGNEYRPPFDVDFRVFSVDSFYLRARGQGCEEEITLPTADFGGSLSTLKGRHSRFLPQ